MNEEWWFLISYFSILALTRITIMFMPASATIFTDDWHHIYAGFLIIGILFILIRKELIVSKNKKIFLYGLAIALIMDELVLLFIPYSVKSKAAYFSLPSVFGAGFLSAFVVIKRKFILKHITK